MKDKLNSDDIDPESPIPLSVREKVILIRELRKQHGVGRVSMSFQSDVMLMFGIMSAHEKADAIIEHVLRGVEALSRIDEIPVSQMGTA